MTDYATVSDVEALLGETIAADSPTFTQVTALLTGAHALVRSRVPAIDARVSAGTVSADAVKYVITDMVLGVLRNPSGLKMEIRGIFQRQIDTSQANARMALSDDQLAILGEFGSNYSIELVDDVVDNNLCMWRHDPYAGRDYRRWSDGDFGDGWS